MKTGLLLAIQLVNWQTGNSPNKYRAAATRSTRHRVRRAFVRAVARACLATFLGLVVMGGEAAAATTWYVDSTLGTDSPTCGTASGGSACKTIQFTINKASFGDTIMVAAGLPYVESVNVDKGLFIAGPNVGISPNGGSRVLEAIINAGASTPIRISRTEPVTMDGFTFSGGTGALIVS